MSRTSTATAVLDEPVAQTGPPQQDREKAADNDAIRPFRVNVPEAELTELRKRINATRWPERETVADASQGVPLATMQKLAHYWATEYEWRSRSFWWMRCARGSNSLRGDKATAVKG